MLEPERGARFSLPRESRPTRAAARRAAGLPLRHGSNPHRTRSFRGPGRGVSRTSGCAIARYRSRTGKPAEAVSLLTLCSTSRLPRGGGQESAREAIPRNRGAHPSPSRGGSASWLCRSDWVARAPIQHTCTRVKPEPMLAGNSVRGHRYGLDMRSSSTRRPARS